MKFELPITIRELIESIVAEGDRETSYCVYGHGDSGNATLDATCFLSSYPEISPDDEEVTPSFALSNGLELWYRDELVQDVVENALHQNPSVSNAVILEALKFYDERDCFMTISRSSGPFRRLSCDVRISTRSKDAQVVSLIKLLRSTTGLSLPQSKEKIDLILNGVSVDFRFDSSDTAAKFAEAASSIGFTSQRLRFSS